jgi:hypothetical protein
MASPKQVDLIISLWTHSGILHEKAATAYGIEIEQVTPRHLREMVPELRDALATKDLAWCRRNIAEARARMGWDPASAPATEQQRLYIGDLEVKLYGRRVTAALTPLTYSEADARIKNIKAEISSSARKPASRDRSYLRLVV